MVAGMLTRASALALVGTLGVTASSPAAPPRVERARVATRYVVSQQGADGSFLSVGTTADAVVSLVTARRAPRQIARALDYLRAQAKADGVTGVGRIAKVVMAVVAAGGRPRRFTGRNLVKEIKSTETPAGRFGEGTPVFEHALALLALAAARGNPSGKAATWLVEAQCADGGWQYDEPPGPDDDEHCVGSDEGAFTTSSDTNTTALAVQALAAVPGAPEPVQNPIAFFRAARDRDFKGWGFTPDFSTDANSTAMVLQAFVAAGRDLPRGAMRALKRLQHRLCGRNAGAFAYTWEEREDGSVAKGAPNLLATIAAIPGLLRQPLPIGPAKVSRRAPKRKAC